MADVDRELVRAIAKEKVAEALGPMWSKTKGLIAKIDLNLTPEEKVVAARRIVVDLREASEAYWTEIERRIDARFAGSE